jgi:predicted metal-dependent hydrolase
LIASGIGSYNPAMTPPRSRYGPLRVDGQVIDYEVARRARVTRRIHLELGENGGLRVIAPRRMSRRDIHRTLLSNPHYVARFLSRARAFLAEAPPLRYVDGERHLLLGRRYLLHVRVRDGERRRVEWAGGPIRVITPEPADTDMVRKLLLDWYRRQALQDFPERLAEVSAAAPWTHRRSPPLRLRRMKASWGTCSADGVITLNPLLLRAPSYCVDYVIAHEVCHLRQHNHGPRFYALQEQLFPAWRKARQHLSDKGHLYMQV